MTMTSTDKVCAVGIISIVLFLGVSSGDSLGHSGHSIDVTATEKMELHMLKMLGLSKRPRPKENATAPQFMWEMYNLMNEQDDQVAEVDRDNGAKDCVLLDPSIPGNIVRSFPCKVLNFRSRIWTLYQVNWVVEFNLSSISPTEKLTGAHLRLESLINLRAKTLIDYFQISIVSVSGSGSKLARMSNVLFRDLLSNHTSKPTEVGVDVLPLIQDWRNNVASKHLLNITIKCLPSLQRNECDRYTNKLRYPSQRSVNLVTVSMEGEKCKERKRRSAGSDKKDPPSEEVSEACQRHSLYVGFREVGWDDWIIAPTGYQAYYCAGECPFPIGEQQNGTNHAVIQTLVRRSHYRSVPDVCCAPVRLSPISLLFFDDDENVVLRRYDDMIVESCGCR